MKKSKTEIEKLKQAWSDASADSEQCRELLNELRSSGGLGELLLSDALSLLLESPDELSEIFSAEECEELNAMLSAEKNNDDEKRERLRLYTLEDDDSSLGMVAEDDAEYKKS